MFRFQSSDRTLRSLETAAMADIVFLLLIFFLLSSSFILPTQIPVNPPESDASVVAKEEPVVVTITRAGEIYLGNEKVLSADLGSALAARLRDAPIKAVVVRGDETTPLSRLVEVMDLAIKGGAEKLAIATEDKRSGRRRKRRRAGGRSRRMGPTAAAPLLELAMTQLPHPVLVLDGKCRVLASTPAACAVLRIEPEELAGRDLHDIVKAEDPHWLSIDPVDRLGTPRSGRKLKARVNGARRNLRVGVWPLGEEGDAAGLLVSIRDGRAESDPQEVKDHLTSLGELSACVAHEIRNPLTGIRTTVQYVISKLPAPDPQRETLGEVITEIDRIEQFIEDLLLFSRPAEVTRTKGDLNALLARVLDAMAPQFEEAEVEVRRTFSPELPPFAFSADGIQQVVQNLLRNGVEAMPEGGKLRISTTLRRFRSERPPAAEIFVSDTGHGIPEDLLDQIFKPFFTTRASGTGLGLPISASIVRAHGGRIGARNRASGGAAFRVTLPMADENGTPP